MSRAIERQAVAVAPRNTRITANTDSRAWQHARVWPVYVQRVIVFGFLYRRILGDQWAVYPSILRIASRPIHVVRCAAKTHLLHSHQFESSLIQPNVDSSPLS